MTAEENRSVSSIVVVQRGCCIGADMKNVSGTRICTGRKSPDFGDPQRRPNSNEFGHDEMPDTFCEQVVEYTNPKREQRQKWLRYSPRLRFGLVCQHEPAGSSGQREAGVEVVVLATVLELGQTALKNSNPIEQVAFPFVPAFAIPQ